MNHRLYPNADRALRQLDRDYQGPPVLQMPECLRPMADSFDRLREGTEQAAEQGYGAGIYVLSMRRPGVVSGGA
ncbi:hypothetical protein ADK57_25580 [Streptomyces sp. MMG1533]|uniref:hypothetical protein n=1 Tax=Streptomyces sp. MMG1533 TaxID=1415546 RepID=UPI0006AF274A|nr:hypothetical protein [Streptomyces sp. MMG1533]KOU62021.1 hypothetical protein ADK57_25580 [Streptomyces sp. MMG1533]